jgi:hypothetical protein
MLSSLLIAYVKDHYPWLKSAHSILDTDCNFGHDNEEPEGVHMMRITMDGEGQLLETNQVNHYIYRADTLSDMNFYDFCHCVRLEPISKSAKLKNTFETQLGVLRRHTFKSRHPNCKTHVLVEHTNDERGDEGVEHVPCVIGMSIPCLTNVRLWAIFALAHFKAFDVSTELLGVDKDPIKSYAQFAFCSRSLRVMKNWEAVYECKDEHDADRLRKCAQLTSKSKALTASVTKGADDEELDFALQPKSTHHSKRDFRIQQAVLELQQAGWLECSTDNTSSLS